MEAAFATGAQRLLFFGSVGIYRRDAAQPMTRNPLMTEPLETTQDAYEVAKLACAAVVQSHWREHGRAWISYSPTNLYGSGDKYDLETSHVLPALIRSFQEAAVAQAPSVTLWGTGTPRRESCTLGDLVATCAPLLQVCDDPTPSNFGIGENLTIAELAGLDADPFGHQCDILWDTSRPTGTPHKLLNVDPMRGLGWSPTVGLDEGLEPTWIDFTMNSGS
jgi:GDP-L-fucose synthase